jgi:hypothetical protein
MLGWWQRFVRFVTPLSPDQRRKDRCPICDREVNVPPHYARSPMGAWYLPSPPEELQAAGPEHGVGHAKPDRTPS